MSLLLICIVLQACSTAEKTDINNADGEKVTSTTTDQTKKKGIVLIDDNGKLGDLFKSG
jgi:major membrane immunogen (membrane-anchored lipoprotein)